MSLRVVVAAPFKQTGRDRMPENEFVVALSLDRDWVSPDGATKVVDTAEREGLVSREDGALRASFDPSTVEIPPDFAPDESLLAERSVFERVLDAVTAGGGERRAAVAGINRLQRDLGVTADAAAVLYARGEGVTVGDAAAAVRADLTGDAAVVQESPR